MAALVAVTVMTVVTVRFMDTLPCDQTVTTVTTVIPPKHQQARSSRFLRPVPDTVRLEKRVLEASEDLHHPVLHALVLSHFFNELRGCA